MLPVKTIYKFHVENLRSISGSITQVELSLHHAISTNNTPLIESLTRLLALTLGAWAETRLSKLLYEDNGFSEPNRGIITAEKSQFDKWKKAIEIAVRTHYNIPNGPLTVINLGHSIYSRYQALQLILEEDLRPVIEIRNKLAHGQWIYPFTETLDLSVPQKTAIENENVLSLQFKHLMLVHLSQIIHDLVISRPTFERDFDTNYRRFAGVKQNLKFRSFGKYCLWLKARHERGKAKRLANSNNNV